MSKKQLGTKSYHDRRAEKFSDRREKVHHPQHYNTGNIEIIDAIEDWKLGFNLGNAVKYIARAPHKGNQIEDLTKAFWYLVRELVSILKVDPTKLINIVTSIIKAKHKSS